MRQITANEVAERLKKGEALNIIDVRDPSEVAQGKIHGITNIPLGLLEYRMHELDKKKEYIIVCHSGGRSAMATNFLENYGFNVMNMMGGMLSWAGPIE